MSSKFQHSSNDKAFVITEMSLLLGKAPFIATELNTAGRPVELSCVAINGA